MMMILAKTIACHHGHHVITQWWTQSVERGWHTLIIGYCIDPFCSLKVLYIEIWCKTYSYWNDSKSLQPSNPRIFPPEFQQHSSPPNLPLKKFWDRSLHHVWGKY